MNILYASPEAAPFAKTGGLADVAGALPNALAELGADVRVILPLYERIGEPWRSRMKFLFHTSVYLAWRKQYCGLFSLERNGVTYYFVDNEYYFKRPNLYGYMDDGERFSFFSQAVNQLLPKLGWKPDVVSCNDWQTALVPVYIRQEQSDFYRSIRTVFTIHNIEYQGMFSQRTLWDVFGLPEQLYDNGMMKYGDAVNIVKGALYCADYITTVSPSYANELKDPAFAHGLHRIVEDNSHKLRGIINGLDLERYDPETDPALYANFSAGDISGKKLCRDELQKLLGLERDPEAAIIACVSRLVKHKGFDLVSGAIDRIMTKHVQLVILGTGDFSYEQRFRDCAMWYPGRISANITYSETLASRVYSGADLFLMPSMSEPCGLAQMISMRYGTIPIVREVGGLKDTVTPYPVEGSNGFTFAYYSEDDMVGAVDRAVGLKFGYPDEWTALRQRCMETDFSWDNSAREYLKIYEQLCKKQ